MNEAHELYIDTYSSIDSIDCLIKNYGMKYRCWKYWHSPMLNAMSLSLVVACDMYLEVVDVDIDYKCKGKTIVNFWTFLGLLYNQKDNNIVDFWTFRDLPSNQMIKYNPTHCKYSGETNIRP